MDKVKFVEDIWKNLNGYGLPKANLPQILIDLFLNTLSQMSLMIIIRLRVGGTII